MADDFSVEVEVGEAEIVWCGEEFVARVPVLLDGVEIGEMFIDSEEFISSEESQ